MWSTRRDKELAEAIIAKLEGKEGEKADLVRRALRWYCWF